MSRMRPHLTMLAAAALAACSLAGDRAETSSAAVAAAERPAPPTRYDAEAFFTTTSYFLSFGHAWSPDAAALLVGSDETGIFNAYALSAADGTATPLTASTSDSTFAVSWFPADARVLYTADQGGNELDHLYVRELDGATRDLTPGEKVKASFAGWSGDGEWFYVTSNERDPAAFDLYRYAAADYARTLVFQNDDALEVAAVSPDGGTVALVETRNSADSDLYLFDTRTAGAEPELITPHEGNIAHGVHEFTRDSGRLVYSTDEHGEFQQAWT